MHRMMIKKTLLIVSGLLFLLFLNVPLFSSISVNTAWAVSEGWESAQSGTYSPADEIPGFFADVGAWIIGDTVSEFPECGPTPHTAEILMWDGSKSLKLNSGTTTVGGCADNIWAVLFTELYLPPAVDQSISIPVTSSTFISFKESGSLTNPQQHGWGSGCIGPPCYDNVSLQIEDKNGNIVSYVLERYPLATPETRTYYKEFFLNEGAEIYERNLFNDFNEIQNFNPVNASIYSITFAVDEHGSATIDDIFIGAGSDVSNPVITITTPTSASSYMTNSGSLNIAGTASDNIGVTQVTWSNDRGGSGVATGTTNWNVDGITLQIGTNVITVTAADASSNTGSDVLTVTYDSSAADCVYDLNLISGWNLISLPCQPSDIDIQKVLESVLNQYSSVWAYTDGSWQFYAPGNPVSDLATMEAGKGYWIDMTEAETLSIAGFSATDSVSLISGWNLVGYNSISAQAIEDALASIAGKYVSVWGFKNNMWAFYAPGNPVSDLTIMEPGYGYWINATEAATWINSTVINPVQITIDVSHDGSPDWSLTSSKIVFSSNRLVSSSIWAMETDGSLGQKLSDDSGNDYQPHWSSDDSWIVFHSDRSGNNDIWMMDKNGANLTQITFDQEIDYDPDLSPDNIKIVFQSKRSGNSDIWIKNLDNSTLSQLTTAPVGDGSPAFSPDGSKIVYWSKRTGNREIWTMDANGSNQTQLTNTLEDEGHLHYSPDGSRIVFWSERTGNREVWIMNADGSNQIQVTNNSANDGGGNWSPDGSKIVFRSDRSGNNDIWIYKLQ